MSNKVCVELKGKQSSDFMRACARAHTHWALLAIGTHSQHLKVAIRQCSTLRCRPGVIKVLHLQLSLIHPLLLFYISCVTSIFQNVAESWTKSRHLSSYKSFSWQSREGNLAPLCSRGRHAGSPWGAKRWKRWRVPFIFVSEVYVGVSVCLYVHVCAPRSAAAFVCVMYFINRRSDSTTCLERQKQPVLICDSCTSASRTEQRSSVDLFLVFAQMPWKMEDLL